jgi:hypothetical protein
MATYVAAARSNTFTVRDAGALRRALTPIAGVDIETPDPEHTDRVALFCEDGWPSTSGDESTGQEVEVSIGEIVAGHLAPGHVAVFVQTGHERLRTLDGVAFAVNHRGQRRSIDLIDIYPLARQLGRHVEEI